MTNMYILTSRNFKLRSLNRNHGHFFATVLFDEAWAPKVDSVMHHFKRIKIKALQVAECCESSHAHIAHTRSVKESLFCRKIIKTLVSCAFFEIIDLAR